MYRRPLFAVLATVILALSGLGLWIKTRTSEAEEDRSASTATKQASAALNAIVRRGLAEGEISAFRQWRAFSGVRSVAGGVPPRIRLAVAETLGGKAALGSLGLEFSQARRTTTPSGIRLWMVPGRGVMCLVRAERLAIACSSKRKAIHRGVLLQIHRASPGAEESDFTTIGVVPDWAAGISLQAGEAPVTLPIQANAFDFSATRSIRVLRLTR